MAQGAALDVAKERAKQEARAVEAARRKLALQDGGGLSGAEREALRARILAWEAEHEWLPQSWVYVEQIDLCACGQDSAHFVGLYQIQKTRGVGPGRRLVLWCPQEVPEGSPLPKAHHRIGRAVPFCPACRELKGFALTYDGQLWAQEATSLRAQAGQGVEALP